VTEIALLAGRTAGPAGPSASTWKRASRRELVVLALYFAGLITLTDIINVRPGVEVMTLAVALAAICISRQPRPFLHDWWFLLAGLIMWNLSGAIAAHSPVQPHLDFMLKADRALLLGRDPVVVVQKALAHAGQVGPLDVLTAIVYNLHLPEPYIVGYFLWRISRQAYVQFAAAALILLVVGFLTFVLFPAVPPWLAAERYGQVTSVFNGYNQVLRWYPMPFHGTPIFYVFKLTGDAVAAFPSEHAAFPLLECHALASCTRRRVWLWLVLWVLAVLFTVVYLGEHWVTDALAGYAYAVLIWVLVRRFTGQIRNGVSLPAPRG